MMTRYVALLRGINVGGRNLIGMAALRAAFEGAGFGDVTTYIQSGNVLFATANPRRGLTELIERTLSASFGLDIAVVLRSRQQLKAIVAGAPPGFGAEPASYRYDVIFLKEPVTARAALAQVSVKEGVDAVAAGRGVLYFSRLRRRATESRLARVAGLPVYKSMTIRNWNTTTKLLSLLDAR